jgi:hypothetical protein
LIQSRPVRFQGAYESPREWARSERACELVRIRVVNRHEAQCTLRQAGTLMTMIIPVVVFVVITGVEK